MLQARRSLNRNEFKDSITHLNNAINAINELQVKENFNETEQKIIKALQKIEKERQKKIIERLKG